MIIKVWLKPNSQPREFEDVENTYVKGSFFCIFEKKLNQVTKYPISKIFRLQVLKAVQRYRKTNDMSIKIILETTQEPIVRDHIKDTYIRDGFYCLEYPVNIDKDQELFSLVMIEMYPLDTIHKVIEPYY